MDAGRLPGDLHVCTDNRGLFTALRATELKAPAEPHLLYLLRALRGRLEAATLHKLWWVDTRAMVSDALTKGGLAREPILKLWETAVLMMTGDDPLALCLRGPRGDISEWEDK
eukprot:8465934-Pyramimonas_sp.AAC.3